MIISQLNINKSYLVLDDIVYWCAVFRVGLLLATLSFHVVSSKYVLFGINVVSTICVK